MATLCIDKIFGTEVLTSYWAADGGNKSEKPVILVRPCVSNPRDGFIRVEKRSPVRSKLCTYEKTGEQKYTKVIEHPEDWEIITTLTVREAIVKVGRGGILRIEPDVGSYHKDKNEIIEFARQHGVTLLFCSGRTSYLGRKKRKILKDEKADIADAIILWFANQDSYRPAKLFTEAIKMDRKASRKILEQSEKSGWSDAIAQEALSIIPLDEIAEKYGEDLATPVFIVTAYVAARHPQVKTREDFKRLIGLNSAQQSRTKKGIGGIFSSNLSHFNKNKKNVTAANYIFHKVQERVA